MARTLATLLTVLALAGCGRAAGPAAGTPASSPSPVPSVSVAPASTLITEADSGRTVALAVGATLEVALRAVPGWTAWTGLRSSDASVLQPVVDTRAAAARGVTIGGFRALAPGHAQLTAASGVACSPGTACPALARAWTVSVVVGQS